MKKIGIIIGSVRETRKGLIVGEWVLKQTLDEIHEYVIVDLKEVNLPHYNEPSSPSSNRNYKYIETRNWSKIIDGLDGFIFVTPEYNGFFTGAIKDAVDYLYHEWKGKPFGIVGYGGKGAKWAADKLTELLLRFEMIDSGFVGVLKPWDSIDEFGNIDPDYIDGNLNEMFKNLTK